MASSILEFSAESLQAVEATFPVFDVVTKTNVITTVALFDDTTQEYLNGKFTVPGGISTGGTVTFRAYGYSGTAAASRVVAFNFDHAAVANDEDLDSASYTSEASGDKNCINNQNDLEEHEWTETVSNLAWVAEDLVFFKISRNPTTSGTNLTGDWAMLKFVVEIPLV